MEDPKWLKLVVIGLVLAAVAVGYFLFTGRFSSNKSVLGVVPIATQSAKLVVSSPSPSPVSAYNRITERTAKGGQPVNTLPRTGFPVVST
ncbi:MAG: hypothetical protein Q7R77_00605, partial [Candidatus Daviesbacteria bacterium]|nr:hypothetical protein [Candidatus Daviesbacteria bacterium]